MLFVHCLIVCGGRWTDPCRGVWWEVTEESAGGGWWSKGVGCREGGPSWRWFNRPAATPPHDFNINRCVSGGNRPISHRCFAGGQLIAINKHKKNKLTAGVKISMFLISPHFGWVVGGDGRGGDDGTLAGVIAQRLLETVNSDRFAVIKTSCQFPAVHHCMRVTRAPGPDNTAQPLLC